MLEIPEAAVVAAQVSEAVVGNRVTRVVAAHSPHRFAFFSGDPEAYDGALRGREVTQAAAVAGWVEITLGGMSLLVNDGVNLRFHPPAARRPTKHQLLLEFADGAALTASVQMYGGLLCHPSGTCDNAYYLVARQRPSPLTDAFDLDWFTALLAPPQVRKLSLKAALATEQRIPGFGNGVLQDVLWRAGLNPRRRVADVEDHDVARLHETIRAGLAEMVALGGRDTEKDLFGRPGGYRTVMCARRLAEPCPVCGSAKVKETYLGGSVYYCPGCQSL